MVVEQNKEFRSTTSDPKAMVVTHIASYFPTGKYIDNAYSDSLEGDKTYDRGYDGLADLQQDLQERIVRANEEHSPYSHLFIMSMGWNNEWAILLAPPVPIYWGGRFTTLSCGGKGLPSHMESVS
jgi:hypothetical protein